MTQGTRPDQCIQHVSLHNLAWLCYSEKFHCAQRVQRLRAECINSLGSDGAPKALCNAVQLGANEEMSLIHYTNQAELTSHKLQTGPILTPVEDVSLKEELEN